MRYRFEKLEFQPREPRSASWTFGTKPVTGTEHPYGVTDRNLPRNNQWEFVVRVPKDPKGRIEVRPTLVPPSKVWTGLDRRGLTFMRAVRKGYTRYRYCQLSLPGDDGKASRHVINRDQVDSLPYWLQDLRPRWLLNKITVTTTRAHDAESLVLLVPRDDHMAMIRMYMATKAWVLKSGKAIPA